MGVTTAQKFHLSQGVYSRVVSPSEDLVKCGQDRSRDSAMEILGGAGLTDFSLESCDRWGSRFNRNKL